MSLHLVLAAFWFVVGAAMLVGLWLRPGAAGLRFGGDGVPLGWVALLFAAYNLVRWWGRRRTPSPVPPPRPRATGSAEDREPRPEFDFSRPDPPDAPR